MKKGFLTILLLILCLSLTPVFAETAEELAKELEGISEELTEALSGGEVATTDVGEFIVTTIVPEGYTYTESWRNDTLYIGELRSENLTYPNIDVTIAFNDEFAGETFTDFTDEELDLIRAAASAEDGIEVEVTTTKTEYGTGLIIYRVETENESMAEIVTLYKGYEISMLIYPGAEATTGITDAEIDGAVTFITNLWIYDKE